MTAEERWVGVDDVAVHLGVAKDSRWIEERGLPAYRVRRLFRFKASEINEWVRQDNEREKVTNLVKSRSSSKTQTSRSTPKDTFTEEKRE